MNVMENCVITKNNEVFNYMKCDNMLLNETRISQNMITLLFLRSSNIQRLNDIKSWWDY